MSAKPAARTLMIVAAGTGGHVMPGLAIAQALQSRGWTVAWLGTTSGMERALVERAGLPFDAISFSSIRGKGALALVGGLFRLARAIAASVRVLRRVAPQVVVTTGGYLAVPAGLAAAWLRRPMLFLNADAAPQLSLRILLRFVRIVLCGFDGSAAQLAGAKARVTGAPVRAQIIELPDPAIRFAGRSGSLALLVVGGSLGARILNDVVPAAVAQLAPQERPLVVHQCGAGNEVATRAAYQGCGVEATVMDFIDDIASRYGAADVVLCRAGAITVTELCAAGVGAILVPFIASTTAHQRGNAEFLAARGAAIHLPQAQLTAEALAQVLRTLRRPRLEEMARNARALGRPESTRQAVQEIEQAAGAAACTPSGAT